MAKTLCDWSRKDIAKKPEKLARLIDHPRFYCAKCARAANDAKSLCKARKLPPAITPPNKDPEASEKTVVQR
jgi:hypothetical protein